MPSAPNHRVKIGNLVRKHGTQGAILVNIDKSHDIEDIDDISISNISNGDILVRNGNLWTNSANISAYALNSTVVGLSASMISVSGSLLSRIVTIEEIERADGEPTGFENRTDSTISWNSSTNTFNISGNYNIWINAVKYHKTNDSIIITPTVGITYIKFNSSGVLTATTSGWDLASEVPIATIMYNLALSESFISEERHGIIMDSATHKYLHYTVGSKYKSGFEVYNYSVGTNSITANTYAVSAGSFFDEDLEITVPALTSSPYTVFYRSGSNGDWTWGQYSYPYYNLTNIARYNAYTGSSWSVLIPQLNSYLNYYIFATNAIDPKFSVISIPGQAYYTALADAEAETFTDLSLGTLPFTEMIPVAKMTYQYGVSYVSARLLLVEFTSLLKQSLNIPTVHNYLSGLQGGTTSQYYHLTTAQYNDYVGKTEVANVSGALNASIASINSAFTSAGVDLQTITRLASMVSVDQNNQPITTYFWTSPILGDTINIRNTTTEGSNILNGNGINIEGTSTFEIFAGESFSFRYNGTQWIAF
jgi:hypothetical protein